MREQMDEMKQKAYAVVAKAVAELAEDMGFPALVNPVESTPLFGGEDGIDSFSLVRLVADIERLGRAASSASVVVLADDRAMSHAAAPSAPSARWASCCEERLGEANA
jgi:acyl carrier protein